MSTEESKAYKVRRFSAGGVLQDLADDFVMRSYLNETLTFGSHRRLVGEANSACSAV